MIYLDNGATSFPKLPAVRQAVQEAMLRCANPGRGGHKPAMEAAKTVLSAREQAAMLFDCEPEQVVFTANCTHGLNIAINTLAKPGSRVLISGFEHNAVTRPLAARGCETVVAGQKLFDQEDTLQRFADALRSGVSAAFFTHTSNVFGYILPVEQMAQLCRMYRVPFVIDAAQSAGTLPVKLKTLGADFIAMPGHKGLLGPQGTGLLLCGIKPVPLLQGGTGSQSESSQMPDFLPDMLEAGTVNVPGIAGLEAGLRHLNRVGTQSVFRREHRQMRKCEKELKKLGFCVFSGDNQSGTISFIPNMDCEEFAQKLAQRSVCVRAGLHCAPLAHKSAGTLQTGTVRISFGAINNDHQTDRFLQILRTIAVEK